MAVSRFGVVAAVFAAAAAFAVAAAIVSWWLPEGGGYREARGAVVRY